MPVNKLLGVVDKNSRERIEVRAAEYEGHPYIDIPTYWRTGEDEDWKPSKKGVTLNPTLVGELIAPEGEGDVRRTWDQRIIQILQILPHI